MVGKKGYFFVVDAMIAATILFLGLFYIFSSAIIAPEESQGFSTSQDFSDILLANSLYTSTNTYYVQKLLPLALVPYPDATPLEEIGYLWFTTPASCPSCKEHAYNFTKSLIDESLEQRYGAAVFLNGTLVYNRTTQKTFSQISRHAIVYVRMNATDVRGPFTAEVQVWY